MGKGLKNLPKQVEILRKKWHMWLKEEKIFFSQTLNLKPEQQYTRYPAEHCLGQKLKFILMMTSGDFDNDKSRFCYERSRFSWWQVKILLRTVEIFMMTGRDNKLLGRGLFRTLSNIYDRTILVKIFNGFKPLTIFAKRLHLWCSTGF